MSKLIRSPEEIEEIRQLMLDKIVAASRTEKQYVDAARYAHRKAVAWLQSDSREEGSFLWTCDVLELDAGVVRRQMQTKLSAPAMKRAIRNRSYY